MDIKRGMPRRVLVFGNILGRFDLLKHVQTRLVAKAPAAFHCAFLVGRTFSDSPSGNSSLQAFLNG